MRGICFDDEHKQIVVCDYNNRRLSIWSSDGSQFITTVNIPNNNQYPWSVCMDKYANHSSSNNNNRIQVFNAADGKFISKCGTQGNGNGQFYTPRGICLHPSNNNIIVADYNNNRVQMLNDQFRFVSMIGDNLLESPQAVDCSSLPPHSIVAADDQNQIHLFSPSSNNNNNNSDYQLVRSFCSNGSSYNQTNSVYGICFDDEHKQIVVCDFYNRRLSIWSSDGSQFITTVNIPNNQYPWCVFMDKYANHSSSKNNSNSNVHRMIVGTVSQILVFDARKLQALQTQPQQQQQQGSVLDVIQSIGSPTSGSKAGEFNCVFGVCVDENGYLWASDYSNHRIQRF